MDDFATGYLAGQDSGGGSNGAFGGGWDSWIVIILFAMIFGWGNGGFGGFGNGGGGQSGADTRAAISEGFALNGLENGIRGVQTGLCDGFYAMNTGMLQGFNGVQGQLANMAAQNQACCCETQRVVERGFADTNYNMATLSCDIKNLVQNATRDVIDNQNAIGRDIKDFMFQEKLSTLQMENQSLKFAASQATQNNYLAAMSEAQTAELIRRLGPTPIPAYQVPAPYPWCGPMSYNSGCGCGC